MYCTCEYWPYLHSSLFLVTTSCNYLKRLPLSIIYNGQSISLPIFTDGKRRFVFSVLHFTFREKWAGIAQSVQRLPKGLDGPRIELRWGWDFPQPSWPALGFTQPPIQWVPGSFSRGWSGRVVALNHAPPSNAEVKERVELYLYFPSWLSWRVLGWPLPLLYSLMRISLHGIGWIWNDSCSFM